MDYAEACEHVYGEPYASWKKKHQNPATEEQMSLFENSKTKHARTDPGPVLVPSASMPQASGGHSNVCGQDCDDVEAMPAVGTESMDGAPVEVRIGVLTCSDRAARGEYQDASGPAVKASISAFADRSKALEASFTQAAVLPDEELEIARLLKEWSETRVCDIIFTTGGTGVGPRDVTPEATRRVIARLADGLSRAMAWQTSFKVPHSILSRGVCGVTASGTLIVNLPGHPSGVKECLSVLLPVLPHAITLLKKTA